MSMTEQHCKVTFPGSTEFFRQCFNESLSLDRQFFDIYKNITVSLELSLELFIVSTLRFYEDIITNDTEPHTKKTKLIKATIKDKFQAPSLGSIKDLANQCYHLIDSNCPDELQRMKFALGEKLPLLDISDLLNDLNKIYHDLMEDGGKGLKITYSPTLKKNLFSIADELIKFRNDDAHIKRIRETIEDKYESLNLNLESWKRAFLQILGILSSILSNTFRCGIVEKVETGSSVRTDDARNISFVRKLLTYASGNSDINEEKISFDQFEMKPVFYEIVMHYQDKEICLDLAPFIIIKDDKLFHYKRTRASGYYYFSICDESVEKFITKKKFSHTVFGLLDTGDQQAVFWTEAVPTFNDDKTIKANIPIEYRSLFVGRKKQLQRIKDEIIEIPNRDGAIYGPGGVGKTALMIELSRNLFSEKRKDNILFRNIIWCSAKSSYYNPTYNLTEKKEKQFESFDSVLSLILRFFEYEDVDEYSLEDKKELVLSELEEDSVLLILDNLESLTKEERDKIIRFIVLDVKKHLRSKPNNFKTIITSREMIPSSFHQISLEGLSLSESKQLMKKLYEPYKNSINPQLSEEQMQRLHSVTHGIPLVIIHSFGQLYEHNRTLESVISYLAASANEVIKFSYEEIFRLLSNDEVMKEIFVLLEIYKSPISTRQVADILNIEESVVASKLPHLVSFQCIEKVNEGDAEKYFINDAVNLLTKALVQEERKLAEAIERKILQNYTLEKQMDYSAEEQKVMEIFQGYVMDNKFAEAEIFLQEQLKKYHNSILLRFHYAKYLKEVRNEIGSAIQILQELYEQQKDKMAKDPNISTLLASCYCSLIPPDYQKASRLYDELEMRFENDEMKKLVGEFYIKWSNYLKNKREPDPTEDIKRKARMKEFADKGVQKLSTIEKHNFTHETYYMLASGYFNIYNPTKALEMVTYAMKLAEKNPVYHNNYLQFKKAILRYV